MFVQLSVSFCKFGQVITVKTRVEIVNSLNTFAAIKILEALFALGLV